MLRWSLRLDGTLLFKVGGIPLAQKLIFVFLKYLIFLKNRFFGWDVGSSSAVVFGKRFYYNEMYGIASLQRVYCEHYTLRELLPKGALVIDVGANIGQFNFFSRHYLKASRVISVEPLPDCFKILQLNAAAPHDCHNLAISDQEGGRTMLISSISSSLSSYVAAQGEDLIASCEVAATTLDQFISDLGLSSVDLLKIDTEGSEYDVICGGGRTLAVTSWVAAEMSACRVSSGDLFVTGKQIEDAGFRLVSLSPFTGYRPSSVDGLFRRCE